MGENTLTASLNLWSECNFNCSFCIGARKDINHKDWEKENRLLDKIRHFFSATGQWEIALIGGEPTINPYLPRFCDQLVDDGHTISRMTTNASYPLNRLFSKETIRKFRNVIFSYHPQHENNPQLNHTFFENIDYALSNGLTVSVIYVLLPERISVADDMVKKFTGMGAYVKISPLYGMYGDRSYPTAYSREEIDFINNNNQNIASRHLLEFGSRVSTLQECSAGYRSFEIFLQSGKIDPCPHQQSIELFNYLTQDAATFKQKIHQTPHKCLERNCICGLTYAQRAFLEKNSVDNPDPKVYEEWKKLCSATPEIAKFWEEAELKFINDLKQRIDGKTVFIWGAGVHTSKLYDLMVKNGFPIEVIRGLIDSNPKKDGQLFHHIPIYEAQRFLQTQSDQCSDIIISSASYEKEIFKQIKEGIPNSAVNIIGLYDGSFGARIPI